MGTSRQKNFCRLVSTHFSETNLQNWVDLQLKQKIPYGIFCFAQSGLLRYRSKNAKHPNVFAN